MTAVTKTTRTSGIELLRIIAACFVIVLHFNGHLFKIADNDTILYQFMIVTESVSVCAVDIFIIISGYFLCTTQERKIGKIAYLIIQLLIFNLAFYIVSCFIGVNTFSLKIFIFKFIPKDYFVVLYTVLYLISPYINKLLNSLDKNALRKFIFILLLIFSVYATFTDVIGEMKGEICKGMSPIGSYGNQYGFNIINFILLYIVGAFIRKEHDTVDNLLGKPFIIPCIVLCIVAWAYMDDALNVVGLRSAWCYHNIFVISLALSMFIIAKRLSLNSQLINRLAKSSFTCYILHGYILKFMPFNNIVHSTGLYLVYIVSSLILIYIICWVAWFIFDNVSASIIKKLDRFTIDYKF